MKNRTDFVSNSSTSCFLFPISAEHDKTTWMPNTLRIYPDTNKILMRFDDFEFGDKTYSDSVLDNWKFVCTQLAYWTMGDLIDCEGSKRSKKKIIRDLYMSKEFEMLNNAVIEYFREQGIEMNGVEFDEEDLLENGQYCSLRPDCSMNHESIFSGWEDLMEQAKVKSIAELIWGIKKIEFIYS